MQGEQTAEEMIWDEVQKTAAASMRLAVADCLHLFRLFTEKYGGQEQWHADFEATIHQRYQLPYLQ